MSVARLYHHCAPSTEVGIVTRAMVRLLKGHRSEFMIYFSYKNNHIHVTWDLIQ